MTRARLGSVLEWALAAGCILAVAALGAVLFKQARLATLPQVIAEEVTSVDPADTPAAIPSRAVSVPLLPLSNGTQLRVGETAGAIAGKLNKAWQIGADAWERTSAGERVVRTYDDGARHFLLVMEDAAGQPEFRLSAIYLR